MKIFKYTVEKRGEDFFITAPQNLKIIRMDFVSDNFYHGNFVWAIVNPDDSLVEQKIDYEPTAHNIEEDYYKTQLRVKEKQDVIIQGEPIGVGDNDGKLYLLVKKIKNWYDGYNKYRIHFYKTGQPILEPIEDLKYIGFCRLWIMQELGLYAFLEEL